MKALKIIAFTSLLLLASCSRFPAKPSPALTTPTPPNQKQVNISTSGVTVGGSDTASGTGADTTPLTMTGITMNGGSEQVGVANPASKYCADHGGKITIKKNLSGAEYGVCMFEDNRQCEEWALFRGDCKMGGRKITGFDNEAEVYCAINGGDVVMNVKPVRCDLPIGKVKCSADDFYKKGPNCALGK